MDKQLIEGMKAAGVQIEKFHPPHWSHLGRLNNRTHRKLLVIDGRMALTGGVGIAPQWTGQAQDPDHWRDTHFRVEGPVVAQMFSSSPSGGSESMQLMYLLAITSASRSIDLSASYFVPDDLTLRALVEAMKRGVKLRIIVPGEHMDSETVRSASRARWGNLLSSSAVIAEYQPTMFHCKVMIMDRLLVSVGSTNFDNRSFRLNDDATLNIIDADFVNAQTAIIEADLDRSRRITYAERRERPLREKVGERLASLFGSQL